MQKVDATCDTQGIIQMVDANCDTKDLMVGTKDTKDMESSIQLMEEIFIKMSPKKKKK
jgi:hypothetical protein